MSGGGMQGGYGGGYGQPSYGSFGPSYGGGYGGGYQSRPSGYGAFNGGYGRMGRSYQPQPFQPQMSTPDQRPNDPYAAANQQWRDRLNQINQPPQYQAGGGMVSQPFKQESAVDPGVQVGGNMAGGGIGMQAPDMGGGMQYGPAPGFAAGKPYDPYQTPGIVPDGNAGGNMANEQLGQQVMGGQDQMNVNAGGGTGPYEFKQGPSTLDPGSNLGLLAFLGGNGWQQQAQAYPGQYQAQWGQQAPGGPRSYWG